MKETEEKLDAFFYEHKKQSALSSEQDERILRNVLAARNSNPSQNKYIWSRLMRRNTTWISAAVVVLFIGISILFFNKATTGGYAIAQTIQAVQEIENVYFKATLFKQGPIECLMKFSPDKRKPTNIRLYHTDHSVSKIDSEYGSFTYNNRTGHYRQNSRNERNADWYPDFRNLFFQALESAQSSDRVRISGDVDPDTLQEMTVIDVSDPYGDIRFWIDPETLLPVRFAVLDVKDPAYFMRQTVAVREMYDIRYDQILPEDAFQIPADAEEVFEEVDVYVSPDVGMPVGDMSEAEACIRILQKVTDALNNLDIDAFANLTFPHGFLPREMLQQMLQAGLPKNPDGPRIELLSYETPYHDGPFWYVKHTTRQPVKGTVTEVMPVRFYEFDGIRYCIIAYPD
jgi:hypothetical protein